MRKPRLHRHAARESALQLQPDLGRNCAYQLDVAREAHVAAIDAESVLAGLDITHVEDDRILPAGLGQAAKLLGGSTQLPKNTVSTTSESISTSGARSLYSTCTEMKVASSGSLATEIQSSTAAANDRSFQPMFCVKKFFISARPFRGDGFPWGCRRRIPRLGAARSAARRSACRSVHPRRAG